LRRLLIVLALTLVTAAAVAGSVLAGKPSGGGTSLTAYYPDLRTVVPQHLGIQNQQQRMILRFSNGIANTGGGPWAMRPEPPPAEATTTTTAVQEIRDKNVLYKCGTQPKQITECYNVLAEHNAGTFEFHPAHNHWHIGDVALFEVRQGSPTGPVVGGNSIKVTFCLIDWYKLDDNARTAERVFFDCYTSFQGISVGWVDQYHQSTEGQQLDLTGLAPADDYYLVSTANYARTYLEQNYDNNTAWVKFRLYKDSNGNTKIEVTGHSPCDSPGLCGEGSTNR
jgi:hypothetical protein